MAAEALIPRYYNERVLGGSELGVVFISTDYKFDLLRLVAILERKLILRLEGGEGGLATLPNERNIVTLQDTQIPVTSRTPPVSLEEPSIDKELIKTCLKKLYVFNCDSIHNLTMTVVFLKQFLVNSPHVELILVDHVLTTDHTRHSGGDQTSSIDPMLWMNLLLECSRHSVLGLITEPHNKLGVQEWQQQQVGIVKHKYNVKRQVTTAKEGPVFRITCSNSNQFWNFNINNNGVSFRS